MPSTGEGQGHNVWFELGSSISSNWHLLMESVMFTTTNELSVHVHCIHVHGFEILEHIPVCFLRTRTEHKVTSSSNLPFREL
jgi:hypothetical protein